MKNIQLEQSRITPEKIFYSPNTGLNMEQDDVFVFGSNLSGVHGAGAAKFAFNQLGYPWGKMFGFNKDMTAFAIPTKDINIETLPLKDIEEFVTRFIGYAKNYKKHRFLVTEIGCGLAGYTPEDIAPMFKNTITMENICLPKRFWNVLLKSETNF